MNLSRRTALWVVCALVLAAAEVYVVFVRQDGAFRIEGQDPVEVPAFSDGAEIAHAFLMDGDGLDAVAIRLASDRPAHVRLRASLLRGSPEDPAEMRLLYRWTPSFDVSRGWQWRRLTIPREADSHDRWYTLRLQLEEARARGPQADAASPNVSVVVSRDNPPRGGALFIDDRRYHGSSLFLRAYRPGTTLYARVMAETEAHLPPLLRPLPVQLLFAAVLNWAFLVFAYAMIEES